jgi:SpoVK/Ycf46/Vps4 family AAA+-type ATPase
MISRSCKVVITTNQEIHNIDSALIRPGRCFDFLILEPLTRQQARDIWIKILGLDDEDFKKRFGADEIITQANLMSEYYHINSQMQSRLYNKTGNTHYSINQKIQQLGICADSDSFGGFRAN